MSLKYEKEISELCQKDLGNKFAASGNNFISFKCFSRSGIFAFN